MYLVGVGDGDDFKYGRLFHIMWVGFIQIVKGFSLFPGSPHLNSAVTFGSELGSCLGLQPAISPYSFGLLGQFLKISPAIKEKKYLYVCYSPIPSPTPQDPFLV